MERLKKIIKENKDEILDCVKMVVFTISIIVCILLILYSLVLTSLVKDLTKKVQIQQDTITAMEDELSYQNAIIDDLYYQGSVISECIEKGFLDNGDSEEQDNN